MSDKQKTYLQERVYDLMGAMPEQKVFIADGANRVWNRVDDFYGDSVQILDFFHAIEKLNEYASFACNDEQNRRLWLEENFSMKFDL